MGFAPSELISAGAGGSGGGGWAGLFQNPEFLSLLAGMGAKMGGPGSVGEAIGAPTQQMIQSRAMRETLGEQEKASKEWREMLLNVLGGLTPKEMPGPTSMKVTDAGATFDVTRPGAAGALTGAAGAAGLPSGTYPYDFSAGGVATPTAAPTPTRRRMDISDILPFS